MLLIVNLLKKQRL